MYYITQETRNIHGEKEKQVNEFIVIDNGNEAKRFERITTNTELPALTGHIHEDFVLNEESALNGLEVQSEIVREIFVTYLILFAHGISCLTRTPLLYVGNW